MRRIIIHGLRPEFKGLVTATRGWATQPTLDELENILSNEETLDDKMSKVAVKDYEEEALFTGNRGRSIRNDRWRRRKEGDPDHWRRRDEGDRDYRRRGEDNDEEERRSQLGGAQRRDGRSNESHQQRRFDGICYNCGKKGHIARYCRSENKPLKGHAVITSGSLSDEEWDMEALAAMGDGELESATIEEEEDWNFEDSMMITEDEEGNISIEETWGEANGEIKLKLLEIEEEAEEQLEELPEKQEDNEEGEEIQVSEIEVDQETANLNQPQKILEFGEELEKPLAQRSSKTQQRNVRYTSIAIAEEGRFQDIAPSEKLCQDTFPEELSNSKLQELQEQLNIRRRKSVSRGSIEKSPPT